MRKFQKVRHFLKRVAPFGVAAGLVFSAVQAHAYYGGYRGGHYGGYYGSSYGGYYGGYSRQYGRYGYNGYRGGYYRGYRGSRYYGGYPYRGYSSGGAYSSYSNSRPRPPSSASTYNGGSNPAPQSNSGASRESGPNGVAGSGWARLADGQYSTALSAFAAEATTHPNTGLPKVGYALSAAAAGDLRRGVWAMRRALEIDPDSIHYVMIDVSLRPRIEQLVTRYQTFPDRTSGNADAAFMLASLHYLLGDAESARIQVDLGAAAGDRSSSRANLARLVDKKIAAIPRLDTGKRAPRSREDADGGGYSSRGAEKE